MRCAGEVGIPDAPGPAAVRRVAEAIAEGALGPGLIARIDGQAITLSGRWRGRLEIDGARLSWTLSDEADPGRWLRAILWAATASALATLALLWPWWYALPAGLALGAARLLAGRRDDRRALREALAALAANLPLLLQRSNA